MKHRSEQAKTNDEIPEFGLVIQGPVLSNGMHGGTLGTESREAQEYDCRANIQRYLDFCDKHNIPAVVSTWEDSVEYIDGTWPCVVSSKQVALKTRRGALEQSKYLQAFSTLEGIRFLEKYKPKNIIKVRTDININLSALITDYNKQALDAAKDETYFVPFMDTKKPWSLQDFYFVATFSTSSSVWESYLSWSEFHMHVHQDYFWKIGFALSPKKRILQFPLFGRPWNKKQFDMCMSLWDSYIPLSKTIWDNITWRGEQIGPQGREFFKGMTFSDWNESKSVDFKNLISNSNISQIIAKLPTLFSTDIKRYLIFVFRKNPFAVQGLNILFAPQSIIELGLVNFIRSRIGHKLMKSKFDKR